MHSVTFGGLQRAALDVVDLEDLTVEAGDRFTTVSGEDAVIAGLCAQLQANAAAEADPNVPAEVQAKEAARRAARTVCASMGAIPPLSLFKFPGLGS